MQRLARLVLMLGGALLVGWVLAACSDPRTGIPTPTPTLTPIPAPVIGSDGLLMPRTTVAEDIAADSRWTIEGQPYHVLLPIRVAAEATLTIDPGVTVYFEPGTSISVNGTLVADNVVFQPRYELDTWSGLFFNGPTQSSISNSSFTSVSNAVTCNDSYPRLVGNTISGVENSGILMFVHDNPEANWEVSGNRISDVGDAGIKIWVDPDVFPQGSLQVTNNTIENAGQTGLHVASSQWFENIWHSHGLNLLIAGNNIQNTTGEGILIRNTSGITIRQNTITGSTLIGVSLQPAHDVVVEYNVITGNGAGLMIEEARKQPWSNVLVQCNQIEQNIGNGVQVLRQPYPQGPVDVQPLTIANNSLAGNGEYALWLGGENIDLLAPANWWGSADLATVQTAIRDDADTMSAGIVQYAPIRSAAPALAAGQCP